MLQQYLSLKALSAIGTLISSFAPATVPFHGLSCTGIDGITLVKVRQTSECTPLLLHHMFFGFLRNRKEKPRIHKMGQQRLSFWALVLDVCRFECFLLLVAIEYRTSLVLIFRIELELARTKSRMCS